MRVTLNLRPRVSTSPRLSRGITGTVFDSRISSFWADFLPDRSLLRTLIWTSSMSSFSWSFSRMVFMRSLVFFSRKSPVSLALAFSGSFLSQQLKSCSMILGSLRKSDYLALSSSYRAASVCCQCRQGTDCILWTLLSASPIRINDYNMVISQVWWQFEGAMVAIQRCDGGNSKVRRWQFEGATVAIIKEKMREQDYTIIIKSLPQMAISSFPRVNLGFCREPFRQKAFYTIFSQLVNMSLFGSSIIYLRRVFAAACTFPSGFSDWSWRDKLVVLLTPISRVLLARQPLIGLIYLDFRLQLFSFSFRQPIPGFPSGMCQVFKIFYLILLIFSSMLDRLLSLGSSTEIDFFISIICFSQVEVYFFGEFFQSFPFSNQAFMFLVLITSNP